MYKDLDLIVPGIDQKRSSAPDIFDNDSNNHASTQKSSINFYNRKNHSISSIFEEASLAQGDRMTEKCPDLNKV